ncbi:hypothetical protein [Sphingomonas sp. MMS24-J13]|uniref:hypothetical protein n=1 Tax=Sphingomonas sp. MMS24-J13 TaxID=3238686 RepID=UPI00384EFBC1
MMRRATQRRNAMKKLMLALTAAALIAAPSIGAPCKDPKTKRFIACPPAAAAPAGDTYKDKTGKCHWSAGPKKGKFAPCPK